MDIRKYFITNENDNSDATPVHYEKQYEQALQEIMKQIMCYRDSRRYFDKLPIIIIIHDLLKRPLRDEEFIKLYQERELPFESETILDYIFKIKDREMIVKNREWIADLYKEYGLNKNIVLGENHAGLEEIMNNNDLWSDVNMSSFKNTVYEYLVKVNEYLKLSISELYAKFLFDFENEMIEEWKIELYLMSIFVPEYKDVVFYLEEYYKATGNKYELQKLYLNNSEIEHIGE